MKIKAFLSLLLTGLLILLSNASALACSACYNPAGSKKMTDAASVGIAAMVVIMFAMLGTISFCGWVLAKRAKNPLPDYDELLSDDDDQESKP